MHIFNCQLVLAINVQKKGINLSTLQNLVTEQCKKNYGSSKTKDKIKV